MKSISTGIEDRLLKWLQARQNRRRFNTEEVTYQDCMDLMFVLARRLNRLETKVINVKIDVPDAKSFKDLLDAQSNFKRDS